MGAANLKRYAFGAVIRLEHRLQQVIYTEQCGYLEGMQTRTAFSILLFWWMKIFAPCSSAMIPFLFNIHETLRGVRTKSAFGLFTFSCKVVRHCNLTFLSRFFSFLQECWRRLVRSRMSWSGRLSGAPRPRLARPGTTRRSPPAKPARTSRRRRKALRNTKTRRRLQLQQRPRLAAPATKAQSLRSDAARYNGVHPSAKALIESARQRKKNSRWQMWVNSRFPCITPLQKKA